MCPMMGNSVRAFSDSFTKYYIYALQRSSS
jgi:hypothetical protein